MTFSEFAHLLVPHSWYILLEEMSPARTSQMTPLENTSPNEYFMKTLLKVLFLFVTISLSGCFDILEELWLNKDQSGRYDMTITMGAGPMANMMQAAQKKTNDSLIALGLPPRPSDTMIYLTTLPDSIQRRLPYADVVKNLRIHMKMEKGVKIQFLYDFKHLDSLYRFWETLSAIEKMQQDSSIKKSKILDFPEIGNIAELIGGTPAMQWSGKELNREMKYQEDDGSELMGSILSDTENPMLRMMMRNRTYELKFHLPRKVKKVNAEGYEIDGKDVHAKFLLTDIMKDRSKLECKIRMK